ncbi:MAG: ATP-binding domain-containing protein [Bosea sp. (in: a-proteobacteria)]
MTIPPEVSGLRIVAPHKVRQSLFKGYATAMLQRNLIYTGVTRGKKRVVLVGQKKAVAISVKNVSGRRRWSKLDEWLRPSSASPCQPMP